MEINLKDTVRVTLDGEEIGNIDVHDIHYDPDTKKVTISGEFLKDEELIKKILEGPKSSFSIRAMNAIASPKDTVSSMYITRVDISTPYLKKPKIISSPDQVQAVSIENPVEFPECPIHLKFEEDDTI